MSTENYVIRTADARLNNVNLPVSTMQDYEKFSTPGKILMCFMFKEPVNKWYMVVAALGVIVQLIVFKYFYPYASFVNGDSFSYLETAYHNLSINTYPVGYSMFLRLVSIFTRSDTVIVVTQYLLVQASLLSFIFTLFYFYKPTRTTKIILFSFVLFNPVFLYLANYISSDAFFLSLSLIWFTQLFWIIALPSKRLIVINSLVLFLTFTVRYNALFYPVIAIVTLFQGRHSTMRKLGGILCSFLLIGLFMIYTSNEYRRLTGYWQFTPFTGWQTANNALYAYRYVDSSHRKSVPRKFQQLDRMVRNYFDTTRDVKRYPSETMIASTVYMWDPRSPLSIYADSQSKLDTMATALKKWAKVAPLLSEYGGLLIRQYPSEYVKYYLLPNAMKYYAPPVEFLGEYSTGVDSVQPIAKIWFDYKSNKLKTKAKDYKVSMLNFFPVLTGTMNIVLLFTLISYVILKGYRQTPKLNHGMLLLVTLWIINFGFSVFAAPIALRFQLFPIMVSFSFTLFLLEYLVKAALGRVEPRNDAKDRQISDGEDGISLVSRAE